MKIVSAANEIAQIERAINALGNGIHILEAGCGRRWPLKLSVDFRLSGIDQDEESLRIRRNTNKDLDDYTVGSLCDTIFPSQLFNAIYCSYVLEHVEGVEQVLANFADWIQVPGVIVLRFPDDRSVYGFIAKHTPHWFHLIVRRWVLNDKTAGKSGYGPYPVVYESAMKVSALQRFGKKHGFKTTMLGTAQYLEYRPWLKPFVAVISWASLGILKWKYSNITLIMQR